MGLVVLSALYFSQAREVERLREWAGRAPEGSAPITTRRSQPWYSRIGAPYVAVAVIGLLVLGGASAYGVTQLTGDSRALAGDATVIVIAGADKAP